MLDAHAYVMQVKLCKANTRGVTWTYKGSESNLLPSTVRFDRIDGSYDDNNKLKLKNL